MREEEKTEVYSERLVTRKVSVCPNRAQWITGDWTRRRNYTHTYHDQRRTAFVERPNAFIPKHVPDDHERVLGRCGTALVAELDSRFGKLKGILLPDL